MHPERETDHPSRDQSRNHHWISEHGAPRKRGDDLRDHSERRNENDVNLGMTEEPEQMLPEKCITALGRVEELSSNKSISTQHDARGRDR